MKTIKAVAILTICIFILACNKSKTEMNINPLLENFNTPFDAVPFDKIKSEHFVPAFDSLFEATKQEYEKIIHNEEAPTFSNTIVAMERAGERLGLISSVLFNLNTARTDSSTQSIAKEISPRLSDFSNDIILNEKLFERIKTVYNNTDQSGLNAEDKMLLENTYKRFTRNGANLSPEEKERYREITGALAKLTLEFSENVLAETNDYILHITEEEDLAGLTEDFIAEAKAEATRRELDGWVVTLHFPSYYPFLKYANNRELRKKLYMAYASRCLHDNERNNTSIVQRIVSLRLEKAKLLGFDNHADFVLSYRMAETIDKVNTFLNDLLLASMPKAKKEYEEVQEFAKSLGADFIIEAWDWSYYSEKLKKEKYDVNDELTRPYFQLENVEKGVFGLANTLFGISLKEVHNVPAYHPDVKVFEAYDKEGEFLALLYMDYFPRESKKGGAWMTEYRQQYITEEGVNKRPHVSLVFNFTKPTETKPSLLTFDEVTTLLHEFGHGLHGMFSNCNYQSMAGTSVYRDFVELPSQMLENWAEQKEWLDKVAVHYETGEKIPEELVQKIINARNFNSGYFSARQLSFGLTDMKWHTITDPFTGDLSSFEKEAMAPSRVLPEVEGTAMSASFNHIFSGGYAAGYYSYKWAEVLDADAFAYFKENGIFNTEIAEKFRESILSKGGTRHPMELYVGFRGKEPTIEALLERSGLK